MQKWASGLGGMQAYSVNPHSGILRFEKEGDVYSAWIGISIRITTGCGRQNWRAFRPVMHPHDNYFTKRAGVAGVRLRTQFFRINLVLIFKKEEFTYENYFNI